MLRRGLDLLYTASAGLAALSLVGIFLMMMGQVALREMGRQLPGADDLTAYLCVATTFFALAHTFRRGELIRVGILTQRLQGRARLLIEGAAILLAACVVGTIAWFTLQDVIFSYEIEDMAQGSVPFMLWIPKLSMPLGAGILMIAILDEGVAVLRGTKPNYVLEAEDRAARRDFSAEL